MDSARPRFDLVRGRGGLAAVCLATLIFQLPFFDRFFSAMDEGHLLLFADMLANGTGLLYRDATSYPLPGAFEFLALLFRVFEPSILLSRWVATIQFALFTTLGFALLRRLVAPGWAVAGVGLLWIYRVWAFPHWQMYSYSTTALLVFLASLVVLVRFTENGRPGSLALSGLLFGLGVYCKQDYGAATLPAAVAVVVVYARTRPASPGASLAALLGLFFGPAVAIGLLAGLHFLLQGQLAFVVQLTVLNHFVGLDSYDYPAFPPLLPFGSQDPALRGIIGLHNLFPSIVGVVHGLDVQRSAFFTRTPIYDIAIKLFIFGPRLFAAFAVARVWWRRDALRDPSQRSAALCELTLAAWAASLALLSAIYRPQDYLHLAVLYAPFGLLALVYAHALLAHRARPALALVGVPLAVVGAYSGWLAGSMRSIYPEPIALERAGVFVKKSEARLLEDVVAYVQEHTQPGDRVAVMPYFPIVQFLAGRIGPHAASYILWPFPEYPDRDARIIEAMEETGTPLLIWNYTQFPPFPPIPEYAPELYGYLTERFELDRVFVQEAFGYALGAFVRSPPHAALRSRSTARSSWSSPVVGECDPFPRRAALSSYASRAGPCVPCGPSGRFPGSAPCCRSPWTCRRGRGCARPSAPTPACGPDTRRAGSTSDSRSAMATNGPCSCIAS